MKRVVQIRPGHFSKATTLAFFSLLFFCSTSMAQTVRYVATTGNDVTGDGSLAKPYLTILKGITAASTIVVDTVKIAAGTYTAAATTTVSKAVVITGTGANSSSVILNRGSYATSSVIGFTITSNNVTIKRMRVTNYNVGISNTAAVSNLTLDSVQLFENWGSGFSSTFGIDSLAITNSLISYNGKSPSTAAATLKRGVSLSGGVAYSKIRFNNDTVEYNGLAGVEIISLSTTTSIDGINITNNFIRNNDDGAQISVWLGTSNQTKKAVLISGNTIVLSDTARYGIEIRNPAGNGQTSGTGSVVISNNNISVAAGHLGNSRDMAAISVVRKKEGSTQVAMNDQPAGVVVSGNTIRDFQNPRAGEGYGIVFGGTGHKVFGNIISNTEFPLQLQKGNTNYLLNTSAPDAAGQVNNLYFDRDNSKEVCVEVGSNTITTSGSPRLTTGIATTFLTLRGTTTNTRTGDTFCTIQQAIDFAATTTGDTINVSPGTYNEAVTLNKSLAIIGTGATSSDVVLNAPVTPYTAAAGTGFAVSVNNVTIKKIKATNFNVGVSTTLSTISNLRLDSVALIENFAAGFYSTFSLTGLSITNSTLSYNGNKPGFPSASTLKRGIYLLNGPAYSKLVFDNNSVEYNDSTGIEISSTTTATTSIDSVIINNNIVRYNKEAQISAWLGTSTPLKKAISINNNTIVLSDSARYGIEIRNPAGNGTTSGAGSVVVSNNNISVVSHTGNSRDMAAIAVIRRKEGAAGTVNDQPQGVVVSGNTISDFQNPKAGEAYGIVFGGTGHKVFGNIISNTEFPIQLQKGNANFGANTSAPDIAGQTNNLYFDRDNSKDVCVEVGSNTITTSGVPRLTTGTATTSLTLPAKRTTNSSTGETFCSLQQAIDFQGTVTGNTITADAGTYDEQVIINKSLIIDGVDSSNRLATFTGIPAGTNKAVFAVTAQNVTIKNFKFIVDLTKIYSAIMTSGNASGLVITGNTLLSDSSAGVLLAPYSSRNAININIAGYSSFNAMPGIIIQGNTVDDLAAKFRAGVAADQTSGLLVGGDNVNDANNFLSTLNHDVIIRSYYGSQTVKNNMFKGGGIEISISMANGSFIVSNNIFDGTYAHSINSAMARIFTNASLNRTITFTHNQFINQKWAVSFENTRNVTLDSNDITATYDNFRLISVNTKLRQTGAAPNPLETIDIKLTNNNLSAVTGLTTGTAIEFLNFDERVGVDKYTAGNYVIGELGNENNFNANIPTFIKVSNLDGYNTTLQPFLDLYPEYVSGQFASTTAYWTRDIFARHNRYFVNGALKLASAFGEADWNAVYQSIFDRQDDINVGSVVLMPTWSGATSTNWSDSTNWSYKLVPIAGLDAVIFPQVNKPVLTRDAVCDTIVLSNGMSVTTGVYNLTVFGNVRSRGAIYGSLGSIILGGSVNQMLSGSVVVKNLTLNNLAGATIAPGDTNTVIVSGIYTPGKGILETNGNLVLKSDTAGTASVAPGNNGGYITGKVTVERYLSAHKAWRFLSIPTNTAQTVRQSWQEGSNGNNDNEVGGYGIQITGSGGTNAGFDLYSATPSMKTYNAVTNTWSGIATTTGTIIKGSEAYMTFVRGDRTANAFNSTPTPTTLRTKGYLYMGELPAIPVAPNKFAAVGNPYASPLDMRNITKTGLKEFFYLWDPKLGGTSGLGAYQTFSMNESGDYVVTPGMGSYGVLGSTNNYIESGQAFFVQATEIPASLIFKEDSKTIVSPHTLARTQSQQVQLRTSLYGVNADNSTYAVDGVLVDYRDSYSNGVDDKDAIKSANVAENLSIKIAGTLLVVERRKSIIAQDTIFLNLTGGKTQKYRFEIAASQLNQPGLSGFLEDNYLHTSTPLSLDGTTVADFNIVNVAGSYAPDRFRLVFKQLSTLPVTFTSVKAYQQNKNIAVGWKTENESNLKQYDVEKSVDGNHYAIANTTAAKNAAQSNYNWLDVNPSEGNNYYRVRSTGANGKITYSTIVKVYMGKEKQSISVYPNPVVNGTISLQLTSQPSGVYGIRLMNKLGQVMISKQINHPEGSSTETIQLDKYSARGIYQLEITAPDGKNTNTKVSVL